MKRSFNTILGISTILILAGCAKAELVGPDNGGKRITLKAVYESAPETKTQLQGKDDDNHYPVVWSAEDKLKIFSNADKNGEVFTLTSGAGTNVGVFTGNISEADGQTYYAIYPSHFNAAYENNSIQIPMPQTQKYVAGSFGKDCNPALAITNILSTETSEASLNFKNLCGVLQLNLSGDVKVSKISVKDGCVAYELAHPTYDPEPDMRGKLPLWGEGVVHLDNPETLDMKSNDSFIQASYINSSNRFEVFLEADTAVQLTSGTPTAFHIVLPVGALKHGMEVKVYNESGAEVMFFKTEQNNIIERSIVREMPEMAIVPVSHSMTNLSKNGNANTYMVTPNGTYSFDAQYRGNSVKPLVGITRAAVIWQTDFSPRMYNPETGSTNEQEPLPCTNDIITNVQYQAGVISFNTTDTPGDAVIAAYNGNDDVVWSWQIWSSDYDPDTNGTDTYANGAVLMDRNLGATSQYAAGTYYEWGRKDPFIFWENKDKKDQKRLVYATKPAVPFYNANSYGVGYSILHPTAYINGGPGWVNNADITNYQELWNPEKTEYDPCPPGWKVADHEAYYTAPYYNMYSNSYDRTKISIGEYECWKVKISSSSYAFFNYDNGWNVGDVYSNGHMNYFERTLSAFRVSSGGYASDLKQVRCQREGTGTHRQVIDLTTSETANSYVVKPGNLYKFKATVKGNSNESVGAIAKASVIMETNNGSNVDNVLEDNSVGYKDGYIYFETRLYAVYGNAIIVGKDVNDNVLWSWHIWVSDGTPTAVTYVNSKGKTFMKRNLGALSSDENSYKSLGLLYQWGRKDPFLPSMAVDSDATPSYTRGEYVYETSPSAEKNTVKYSIAHPMHFLSCVSDTNSDWLIDSDDTLWGNGKTKYDPCPAGWRVPTSDEWEDQYQVYFNHGLKDASDIWYPAAGYRRWTNGNLMEVGNYANYWTSDHNASGTGICFSATAGGAQITAGKNAAAYPVRCVKDE